MSDIWNPWHGCIKYSEGCDNCYMYYLDMLRDKDGSVIYKVKTNFNLPLKKDRKGDFKIKSGESLRVCMTSDFFLAEADEWRDEIWSMIKTRSDVHFWLQTKRAENVLDRLPDDWGSGYNNVTICFTAENQKRADERLPILINLPAKKKAIMCAPILSMINIEKYLETGAFSLVLADGENYEGSRPCHYEWIKSLYDQCKRQKINFSFVGTGNIFIKDGIKYYVPKAYQSVQAIRSGLNIPSVDKNIKIQPKCATCKRKDSCNGCKWCGKCNY